VTDTPKRLRGRPRGSGKDDTGLLRQVDDLLNQEPTLTKTAAIKQVLARTPLGPGEMEATVVRRLQHKFNEQSNELLEQARGARATTVPSKQVLAGPLARRAKVRRINKRRFEWRQRHSAHLIELRNEAGLTQEDIVEKTGWSIDKVQELEEPTRETRRADGEWRSGVWMYVAFSVAARAVKRVLSHRPESEDAPRLPELALFRAMNESERHDQRCKICNERIL